MMLEEAIVTLRETEGPAIGGYHNSRIDRLWPGLTTHNDRVAASIAYWRSLEASEEAPIRIPIDTIINAVCKAYKVHRADLLSPRRAHYLMTPRYHAIALAVDLRPDLSLSTIGRIFNRDHSTIIHARDAWETTYQRFRAAHIAAVNAVLFPDAEPMVG